MNWYLKRTIQALLTIFVVINLSFVTIRLLPGGPMDYLMSTLYTSNPDLDPSEAAAIARTYMNVNPNKPLWEQYLQYMSDLVLHLDFGKSIWYQEPVAQIIAAAAPWTVFLMSISIIIAFAIGIVMGAVLAYYEGGYADMGGSIASIFVQSVPYYVVAVLLVYVLAYQLQYFPTGGRYSGETATGLNLSFIMDVLYHGFLPMISVIVTGFGGWALGMRGNSIRVLGSEYMRVARLRGLSDSRMAFRYVLRNALLPLYTGFLVVIGGVFGGAVILETIFTYRGLGWYLFQAIQTRDYPLMMGAFILITVAVVIAIYIGDLTYSKLDPRAGQKDAEVY